MTLAEEQFIIDDKVQLTQASELCTEAKEMAQKLLNYYVRVQGQTISQVCQFPGATGSLRLNAQKLQ